MEAAGAVARQPPPAAQQPPGLSPLAVADVLPPKRQAVVDRLRRRIESYRRRQIDCMPRFDQSFSGLCEQNLQDTLALKQRFLETKAKRTPKAKDKKQSDAASGNQPNNQQGATATAALQSSVHVQQKFVKRPSDDLDPGPGGADSFEPPMKVQCTTQQHQSHQQNEVHKFSVEIVQQLEFTTSAANSQPQQISTNVTVKALTNASVKSDVSSPKSNPSTPASTMRPNSGIGCVDIGTLVECKQEPDNEFADLDQCAAALEKDAAANGGNSFAGISIHIGDDSNDEFITPDELKTLISEISDYPEFMKNFDFEDKSVVANNSVTDSLSGNVNGLKTEDSNKELPHNQNQTPSMNDPTVKNTQSPLLQQQNAQYSPPVFENQSMNKNPNRMGYSNMDFAKTELSPAAQTLKQMAEQHQNKHQMGLSFNPNNRTPNARSPYTDFTFQQGDYVGSPNSNSSNVNYHKQSPGFPQPDMIKQEMIFQGQNDFDMQKRKAAANAGMYKQQYSPYGSPSASGHGSPGYLPRGGASGASGGPTGGAFSGGTPPRPPSGPGGQQQATLQINQAQQLHINQSSHGHAIQVSAGQHLHLSGELKGNVSVAAQQGMFFSQSQQQQSQQQGQQQQQQQPGNHQQSGPSGGPGPGQQQAQQQQQQPQQGGAPQHQPGGPQMNPQQGQHQQGQDSYTLSQSQTINFTQQTLKQRANGPAGAGQPNMAPNMSTMSSGVGSGIGVGVGNMNVGPRHTLEQQQKMMQQQQMLRAQQAAAAAAMQQQQQQMGMARPPPPDYKTSAGMMHGMQPRYPAVPPNMRRMPHQPMPPSGIPQSPMMRPHNMYMMSQQHMARGMYPRQQAPMQAAAPDSMPQHGSAEWRHLLMTQQQSASFSAQMRPSFQHQSYNVGGGGNMQMTALQHQQMRTQGMVAGNMGQNPMGQAGQMGSQLNMGSPLNQQMMSHTQQQNMLQQNAAQMSMGGMHMSQSQSMSITNQTIHQTQLNNQQLVNNQNNNQSNALSNFGQTADFSLEFLESLPSADTSNFTDQELLNSFDADAGFNLQDIL